MYVFITSTFLYFLKKAYGSVLITYIFYFYFRGLLMFHSDATKYNGCLSAGIRVHTRRWFVQNHNLNNRFVWWGFCYIKIKIYMYLHHLRSVQNHVTFFSATIDGRDLIFGHKLHIGTPYHGKRFLTHQIPTSCDKNIHVSTSPP
jgi:hypothetical protein